MCEILSFSFLQSIFTYFLHQVWEEQSEVWGTRLVLLLSAERRLDNAVLSYPLEGLWFTCLVQSYYNDLQKLSTKDTTHWLEYVICFHHSILEYEE